jgi:curved DNA-binding protein CbpA
MGNGSSTIGLYDPNHVSIYKKLLLIQSPATKVQMIQTLLAGPDYVAAAKAAGVYAHLLAYVARVNAGAAPPPLPGEIAARATAGATAGAATGASAGTTQSQMVVHGTNGGTALEPPRPAEYVAKGRRSEKAMSYFQNCLLVLGLEEEVALNEEALRSAYKRAAVKAHPDKGGSEQAFEAVTRAHAYLGEIIRRIQGGRAKEGVVEAPTVLKDSRATDAKDWQHVQPVRLNPKKLDMNAFNQMFEQTRIPDPDDEGYGDWLKGGEAGGSGGAKFSGKFNRDVFNRMFEEEAQRTGKTTALTMTQPQALTLGVSHGVELGRGASGDYTAPANAGVKYTDLKQAYTTYNTFSGQVAGVQVENRSFDQFSASRKAAPKPLDDHEMAAIAAAEKAAEQREAMRQRRAAQEMVQADDYFARMKQLVLTDGGSAAGAVQTRTRQGALDTSERHRDRLLLK